MAAFASANADCEHPRAERGLSQAWGSRFLARCLKLLEGLFKPGEDLLHGRFFDTLDGIPTPIMDGFPDRGQLGWPPSLVESHGGLEYGFLDPARARC